MESRADIILKEIAKIRNRFKIQSNYSQWEWTQHPVVQEIGNIPIPSNQCIFLLDPGSMKPICAKGTGELLGIPPGDFELNKKLFWELFFVFSKT